RGVLQQVHRGVVPIPVVADLGCGHRRTHGLGRLGDGVRSKVDGTSHGREYSGRPMRVLIAGTGGVGAYFGARLQQAGNEVWFLARGDNLHALRTRGLRLRSDFGDVDLPLVRAVADATEAGGPVEAVLFCVKVYDNETVADSIAPVVGAGTSITSLQYGVENEELLRTRV